MDKEQIAIERIKTASEMSLAYYDKPLIICHSGGKDSVVLTELAIRAGVPIEVVNHHTTADAPETVYFIRNEFKRLTENGVNCKITYPYYKGKRTSLWDLIEIKGPPSRLIRFCCDVLKENNNYTRDRFIATGVRWDESVKRKQRGIYETITGDFKKSIKLKTDNEDKRKLFEQCELKKEMVVNPIIDWTNADIWNYIHAEHLSVNPLYHCGFNRVGCVGCPMGGGEGANLCI